MIPINLWAPSADMALAYVLVVSFLLGVIHGITPDEHTWPITFAYSVGSYSSKGGAKAGLMFSLGFTIQRSILAELAYFALVGIFTTALAFGLTYIAVGIAMAAAGLYFLRKKQYFHWHYLEEKLGTLFGIHGHHSQQQKEELEHTADPSLSMDGIAGGGPVPSKLALLHGVIAGFGFGAFALIMYTILVPAMPSPWIAFLPGLLFGLGTMLMQIIFGMFFGRMVRGAGRLNSKGVAYVSRAISTSVLLYGGIAFAIGGAAILYFPALMDYGISTGLKVHNLDTLGIGFLLVVVSVGIVGVISYILSVRRAKELGFVERAEAGHEGVGGADGSG